MKKTLIIFSFILIGTSCSVQNLALDREKCIITKNGFKQYKIGETKIDEVIQDYGTNFKKIDDQTWFYQIVYKELGLSFSYGSANIVRAMEFYPPFEGETDKGIELNVSTMADVKLAYDSLDWYISPPWQEWCSEYPGIEFCVNRDTSLPKWPLDENLHNLKEITRIIVIDNYNEFE